MGLDPREINYTFSISEVNETISDFLNNKIEVACILQMVNGNPAAVCKPIARVILSAFSNESNVSIV